MNKVCVAIPVYKKQPSPDEIQSLNQCFAVLKKYPIFLITFEQLDTGFYADLAAKHGVTLQKKLFDASLFANIDGYNRLTKDVNFYKAFSDFEFFLIYQPDAWVFSDQLEYWCSQNYDYIGAPWIPGGGEIDLSPYDGYKFVKSGNGGFSLRKTEYFVRLLSAKGAVYTKEGVARKIENLKKQGLSIKNMLKIAALKCGYANRINVAVQSKRSEDRFYIDNFAAGISNYEMNTPEPEIAMQFAFEQWPEYLYRQNGEKLPFGCHAYKKYNYEGFYSHFIKGGYEL